MREIDSPKFIELVEASKLIEPSTLNALVNRFNKDHSGLLLEVVEKGYLKRNFAGELWARALGVTFVDPLSIEITCKDSDRIPIEMARRLKAIGLYKFDGYMTIAMEDPTNHKLIESLERYLQCRVSPVFAHPEDISHAIDLHYQTNISFDDALKTLEAFTAGEAMAKKDSAELLEMVKSSSMVELSNHVLYSAFRQRASDIHIEAHKNHGIIRLRVDGHLRDLIELPKEIHQALLVRIKFLSELDISDTRLPQDGRFSINIASFSQNFRVSTCPGLHGEKAVIRILGQAGKKGLPSFDELYFSKPNMKRFRNVVAKPNGIFIVTGPTGSGKTTTLYSALDYLNDRNRNIMTIENPVEYQLPGVNHFEVKHGIGLNFASILRAALRQDPDIILVGEIRDHETAKIATEAALTGHMVLTTLHTNNATQAILRLVEIGVDPYMVAPAINGVMSQRLVSKICDHCKEAYQPKPEVLEQYFLEDTIRKHAFFRGKGCTSCHQTGFSGRIAVHEIVEVSEEMREMITNRAPLHELQAAANRVGFRSLREDALKKALLGLTTLDEVERVTVPEYQQN
ncbi:GspE/PulE family protein [Pelagicoccus sp. SDUM812003]|uniref:GspE/PulE family protein n=1 Tax=Pelagicoccus sp. SDUM812003 TaxID=3041267 RepID=UPI00280F8EFF|nr:GspE/PulE family protein [Pelagicoccus sp. SDUM812003]MDQ8202284.1 GspE/PulE family protein [Pelagicoccus sp. SDUM812003]